MTETTQTESAVPETTTNIEEAIMDKANNEVTSEQTTNTAPEESSDTTSEPSLFDEQPSSEDRPEWLPEKFKTPEDLGKSYKELEKKFGAHLGAPEEYEFSINEGLEDYSLSDEDAFSKDFNNVLKENGVNQKTYDELANLYLSKMKADDEAIQFAQNEQFKNDCNELGEKGVNEIKESIKWAKDILPSETFEMLRTVGDKDLTIGKMIKQFHDSYHTKNYVEMPNTASQIVENVDMKEKAREMLGDARYNTDPNWRKQTDELYKTLYSD